MCCRYQWNLKEYLPPALQEELVVLLTEFIYLPWREAQAAAQQGSSQAAGSQAAAVAHVAEDVQVGRCGSTATGDFSHAHNAFPALAHAQPPSVPHQTYKWLDLTSQVSPSAAQGLLSPPVHASSPGSPVAKSLPALS